jgi:hypothetical protein
MRRENRPNWEVGFSRPWTGQRDAFAHLLFVVSSHRHQQLSLTYRLFRVVLSEGRCNVTKYSWFRSGKTISSTVSRQIGSWYGGSLFGTYRLLSMSATMFSRPGTCSAMFGAYIASAMSTATSRATVEVPSPRVFNWRHNTSALMESLRTRMRDRCPDQRGLHARRATSTTSASTTCWQVWLPIWMPNSFASASEMWQRRLSTYPLCLHARNRRPSRKIGSAVPCCAVVEPAARRLRELFVWTTRCGEWVQFCSCRAARRRARSRKGVLSGLSLLCAWLCRSGTSGPCG